MKGARNKDELAKKEQELNELAQEMDDQGR